MMLSVNSGLVLPRASVFSTPTFAKTKIKDEAMKVVRIVEMRTVANKRR